MKLEKILAIVSLSVVAAIAEAPTLTTITILDSSGSAVENILPNGSVDIKIISSDNGGENNTKYKFSVEKDGTLGHGTFAAKGLQEVMWRAPSIEGNYTFKVWLENNSGVSDIITTTIPVATPVVGIVDSEGREYETVDIGTQTWLTKNMYVSHYPDGSAIPHPYDGTVSTTFSYAETGTDTNIESQDGDAANAQWGNHYSWDAAMNGSTTEGAQGICPNGFHIPTHQEFITLFKFLDSAVDTSTTNTGYTGTNDSTGAGAKAKDGGTSGIDFLLTGYRSTNGNFYNRTDGANLWSSTQADASTAWRWSLYATRGDVYRNKNDKKLGFSVRCIKD